VLTVLWLNPTVSATDFVFSLTEPVAEEMIDFTK